MRLGEKAEPYLMLGGKIMTVIWNARQCARRIRFPWKSGRGSAGSGFAPRRSWFLSWEIELLSGWRCGSKTGSEISVSVPVK